MGGCPLGGLVAVIEFRGYVAPRPEKEEAEVAAGRDTTARGGAFLIQQYTTRFQG